MTAMPTFGFYLSNRSVVQGRTTVDDILALAADVDAEPLFHALWVGDALLINRRLDALTLLGALAARTSRVSLGTACMGSFPLRHPINLAYQWASLDVLSGGRMILTACVGGGAPEPFAAESRAFGFDVKERRRRMFEHMAILRRLWSEEAVNFSGQFFQFEGVTVEPRPVQRPCPIWLATNPSRLSSGTVGTSTRGLHQAAEHADGWMTHSITPDGFRQSWDIILEAAENQFGRDATRFGNVLYYNVNIDDDEEAALLSAKADLDDYYHADFSREQVQRRGAFGPPNLVADKLAAYAGSGCQLISLRVAGGDVRRTHERLVTEVLPQIARQGAVA